MSSDRMSTTHASPLFILSGPREIGKTTFLTALIQQAKIHSLTLGGILSPAVFDQNQKIGIDALELRTGIRKRLANLNQGQTYDTFTPRWTFDAEVLEWGNQVLANSTPCDLLIVDELGPIELERGIGWQNGIQALSSQNYKTAIVVIRPELLTSSQKTLA